ncbi:hypothetical protein D3C83_235580 [compost metagenome]
MVAIPAMGAFYFLEGGVDRVRAGMKDAALRLTLHFGKVAGSSRLLDDSSLAQESYGV